jgi:hypothetical protein
VKLLTKAFQRHLLLAENVQEGHRGVLSDSKLLAELDDLICERANCPGSSRFGQLLHLIGTDRA